MHSHKNKKKTIACKKKVKSWGTCLYILVCFEWTFKFVFWRHPLNCFNLFNKLSLINVWLWQLCWGQCNYWLFVFSQWHCWWPGWWQPQLASLLNLTIILQSWQQLPGTQVRTLLNQEIIQLYLLLYQKLISRHHLSCACHSK